MDLMEKYNAIIEEQRESGIIEPVLNENKREQTNSKVHYMPHHAIVREDKSTTTINLQNSCRLLKSYKLRIRKNKGSDCLTIYTSVFVSYLCRVYFSRQNVTNSKNKKHTIFRNVKFYPVRKFRDIPS